MKKKIIINFKDLSDLLKKSKVALIIFIEIIVGIFLSIFSSLIFIKISRDVFQNELVNADLFIINFIYSLRSPFLTDIMLVISFIGGNFIFIASIVVILITYYKKHKHESILFTFILLMGFIVNNLLKLLTRRERPSLSPIIDEPTFSFPSGHAMTSFVFYALLSYFVFHFTKNKKLAIIATILSSILILSVGISRIYLGVHYPSDVLAGFIGGFWWFVTALLIKQTIVFYKLFKESKADRPY